MRALPEVRILRDDFWDGCESLVGEIEPSEGVSGAVHNEPELAEAVLENPLELRVQGLLPSLELDVLLQHKLEVIWLYLELLRFVLSHYIQL